MLPSLWLLAVKIELLLRMVMRFGLLDGVKRMLVVDRCELDGELGVVERLLLEVFYKVDGFYLVILWSVNGCSFERFARECFA